MMRRAFASAALATAIALPAQAAPEIALQPGVSQTFTAAALSTSNAFYVDVPESAKTLVVELNATAAGPNGARPDIDLLLRHGSPIPDRQPDGLAADPEWLFDQAQYRSASSEDEEFIIVSAASQIPLRPGRWFVSVLNFAGFAASAEIRASLRDELQVVPIEIVFDSVGSSSEPCDANAWNDAAPRTPIRGNNGTTLGQQRRNAMNEAARLLTEELKPTVPIRINACWRDLGPAPDDTSRRFTLAQAGPSDFFVGDVGRGSHAPALPQRYTLYAAAPAAARAGTRTCGFAGGPCGEPEVFSTFNIKPDQAGSGLRPFDYGLTFTSAQATFISVAMHEITHGLGFVGLIGLSSNVGGRLSIYDDIYGKHTRWTPNGNESAQPFLRLSQADRVLALTSDTNGASAIPGNLRFAGPITISGERVFNSFDCEQRPLQFAPLHAPAPVEPGSTYSHFDLCYTQELMRAVASSASPHTLGLARNVLYDLGWDPSPKAIVPFATAPDLQYFDPARNGHGIDLRRVAGTPDLYFMGFYTYDAAGTPEWFTSLGRLVDGVFVPARNEFGDSFVRNLYRANQIPQSVVDASAEFEGTVRLDFNQAANSPACLDGAAGRDLNGVLAVMSFELPGHTRQQWCMQPLVSPTATIANNFSSVWYTGTEDAGWGLAVQSLPGEGVAVGVYYADASGKPRWGLAVAPQFVPGQPIDVLQYQGACRTCPAPATLPTLRIGSITLDLAAPGGATAPNNRVSLDVTYPGTEGGRFVRTNTAIIPANEPRYRGN
jgi:hypothetical protein